MLFQGALYHDETASPPAFEVLLSQTKSSSISHCERRFGTFKADAFRTGLQFALLTTRSAVAIRPLKPVCLSAGSAATVPQKKQ